LQVQEQEFLHVANFFAVIGWIKLVMRMKMNMNN